MKALVFDGKLKMATDYPKPIPAEGEALIRVRMAGVCNTDLEIIKGYMGFSGILGHEFVGTVEASLQPELIGRRVVGEINCPCGTCDFCREGLGNHCPTRTVLGIAGRPGAFAEFLTLPVGNLHVVPDSLSDEEAVFTEPLAAALEVLDQVHVRPSERAVVIGDGKLGLLVAQVLALTGCKVEILGRHEDKLAIVRKMGIATFLAPESPKPNADLVVECTGNPDGLVQAKRLIKPRGRIILKSTYFGNVEVGLSQFVVDEVAITGSRCGPFEAALRLLEKKVIDVHSLTSGILPFSEGIEAFEMAAKKGTLKVLVTMNENS